MRGGSPDGMRRAAWQACAHLRAFARANAAARPRAHLLQGLANWLDGNQAEARRHWRKSLAAAGKLGMPYEEGRALHALGSYARTDDPTRDLTLKRASELFERLGAVDDLAGTRHALETTGGESLPGFR